jgi:quercetin 2,3-dioxygenase
LPNECGKLLGYFSVLTQALVFGPGDTISATADREPFKFLVIAGRPIDEPIVQHGPFVMNTQEEIMQAFRDYQAGRLQSADDNPWAD